MKTSERHREAQGRPPLSTAETSRGPVGLRVPSFSSVYRQYFDFVWSSARRFGVEADAIDDLVQEVFIVIHAKLDTLERPEALRSWVYGVVRRTVSTYRRARRTHVAAGTTVDTFADLPSRESTPLERTEQNLSLRLLADLLDQLDEPKREVFALVELEEWTVPEVAEALEIPLNTAYSRLRAARQAFEAALVRHEARAKGK
jgi:RNA polymerase sigma-70 factor, ECF subfamily